MNLKTLAAALLIGVSSTAAMAADLPSRRVAPAPVYAAPIFTWAGFYVGAQVGYAWDKYAFDASFVSPLAYSVSRGGVVGGVHAGYLFQPGPLVFGLEGDIEGASIRGSNLRGSLRGRVGVAFDRVLVYATGGLAIANQNYSWNYFGANSSTRLGWTAGAGVEYAIAPNWSTRVEYRYSDFGRTSLTGLGWGSAVKQTEHSVRIGLSYHFSTGSAGPVVAKY
jgi:outer membrane immunogenic protein